MIKEYRKMAYLASKFNVIRLSSMQGCMLVLLGFKNARGIFGANSQGDMLWFQARLVPFLA
jgi:hypothetical protein